MISDFTIIFCGLREGYSDKYHSLEEAKALCQAYVDEVGLCVTVTPTEYIYKGGREPGVMVGLIRYPRFPETDLWQHGMALADLLRVNLGQKRVTLQDRFKVEMIGDPDV